MSAKPIAILVIVGAMLFAACSPTPIPPTATPVLLTSTNTPVSPTFTPEHETWDLITMGHSFLARSSIAEQYAAFITEDMGIEVTLHRLAVNGQEPEKLLANLRANEELRQLVRDAEAIVFDFSGGWGNSPELKYMLGICEGDDNQQCLHEALEQAKTDWTEMADIIEELTAGRTVLIHVFTFGSWIHDGYYKDRVSAEDRAVMYGYLAAFQEFQRADALARGMYAHHVFPSEAGEPPPAAYFQPDGLHISDEGSLVIANMLRGVGYQPTWTYLIWGSQLQSFGASFPYEYEAIMEEEFGVSVELINYAMGSPAEALLKMLNTNQDALDAFRRAKVMTFDWNPGSTDSAEQEFLSGKCGGADNQDCLRAVYGQTKQDWLAVLDRVIEIRGGDTTGMRQIIMGSWVFQSHYPNISAEQRNVLVGHFLDMASFLMAEAEKRQIEYIKVFHDDYFENAPPENWVRGVGLTKDGDKEILDELMKINLEK